MTLVFMMTAADSVLNLLRAICLGLLVVGQWQWVVLLPVVVKCGVSTVGCGGGIISMGWLSLIGSGG